MNQETQVGICVNNNNGIKDLNYLMAFWIFQFIVESKIKKDIKGLGQHLTMKRLFEKMLADYLVFG